MGNSHPTDPSFLTRCKLALVHFIVGRTLSKLVAKGGPCEVVEQELRGQRYRVFANTPKTLIELFEAARKTHGSKVFLVQGEQRVTFTEFFRRCTKFSLLLQGRFNLTTGDRVCICGKNSVEWCVAFVAVVYSGAVAVPVNSWWETCELDYAVRNVQCKILIADTRRLDRLRNNGKLAQIVADLRMDVVEIAEGNVKARPDANLFADLLVSDLEDDRVDADGGTSVDSSAIAAIVYTSGTSGKAKGVTLSHFSFVQSLRCYDLFTELTQALKGPGPRRCDLVTVPLFHTSGLTTVFLNAFQNGHKLVLMERWSAAQAVALMEKEGATYFGGMPTMLSDILNSPEFHEKKEHLILTNAGTGGAPTPAVLISRMQEAMPETSQGTGWGMTETNSIGTVIGGPDYFARPGSCGLPHTIVDVKVIDPESGIELTEPNQVGEFCIRSPTTMEGYWGDEEATKEVIMEGGWLRTGDMGRIDSGGFAFISGRLKDIVIRGGENISCSEIEGVVYRMNCVAEAAAFGLPHERLGEQLCVVVVRVTSPSSSSLAPGDVKLEIGEHLAKFKVPAHVWIRDNPLPRNATGKILKRVLREEYNEFL